MRTIVLAAIAALPLFAAAAWADDYYEFGGNYAPSSEYPGLGGPRFGGYPGGGAFPNTYRYQQDFYADFYQRYLAFLRECRQHLAFHRELRDLQNETPYGYADPFEAHDEWRAFNATHELWHRDHPYATSCPSYVAYSRWARARTGQIYGGYGWGGYRNDYWRR